MKSLTPAEISRTHAEVVKAKGRRCVAAKALGIAPSTLSARLLAYPTADSSPLPGRWANSQTEDVAVERPTVAAQVASDRIVIMTAAQDDTGLAEAGFKNLEAYAGHRGAEIFVGGFTYQKGLFEDHRVHTGLFAQKVVPLLRPEIVELAPRLLWYGQANILPTAADPLAGWDTNTRDRWAVFPHAKIALRCVPVMPGRPGKQIMTSGVITKPNYVQRNAGQKAEFHHTPGATIAEIKPDGRFWLRQLTMNKDGSFQDLDVLVKNGEIIPGQRVEAITYGDIHLEEIDDGVRPCLWGRDFSDSMLDCLRPRYQFFHDSFSFKARSHHTRHDPHQRAIRVAEKQTNVRSELRATVCFLSDTFRPWSTSVHVASNHNIHLERWLKEIDGHNDPVNAKLWHQLNADWFDAIECGEGDLYNAHAAALKRVAREEGIELDVQFLRPGESYLICQGVAPIECGLHGDVGPRGARGTPSNLSKIVERTNSGHTHEPQIRDGAYVSGTCSRLDLAWATKGPTAWHQSEILTYPSGKRTIITLCEGRYRG